MDIPVLLTPDLLWTPCPYRPFRIILLPILCKLDKHKERPRLKMVIRHCHGVVLVPAHHLCKPISLVHCRQSLQNHEFLPGILTG
jgi:hypothetical protein